MATVNDDTAGVYTCTPYNSYGSMGSSGQTNVILQVSAHFRLPLSEEIVHITCNHLKWSTTKTVYFFF